MQKYLDQAGYGNGDMSGAIDSFWLDGGLRISPDEQIDFLRRLAAEQLPFSARSQALVKEMLIVEQTAAYTLRAKTGWVSRFSAQIGWYVGYLERDGHTYFFALNIESAQATPGFVNGREGITRDILKEQNLLN
jgi:beta-lactamase class D